MKILNLLFGLLIILLSFTACNKDSMDDRNTPTCENRLSFDNKLNKYDFV